MLFSSPIFVFLFLPLVLGIYFVAPRRLRNTWLLLTSIFFYAWGEPVMVAVMLLSIVANWSFGRWVERARDTGGAKRVLAIAVAFNLGLLIVFKYSDWIWSGITSALFGLGLTQEPLGPIGSFIPSGSMLRDVLLTPEGHVRLPLGVSFFTFQATSYVIDVFRRDVPAERSPVDFGMYKAFFPQLIAGPIVRYRDVHEQIHQRRVTLEGFVAGIRRFVIGLGKKMLIANVCAEVADRVFGSPAANMAGIPAAELTPAVAWLGVAAYTAQIYFDFSGYSDMAIGLGRMFGFKFLENFNYPYSARSITDFWRRWHISLSSWFRDYLYIPLGGNRLGRVRTYFNLLAVFALCGLWHGASSTFLVWGLYHGLFLVLERLGLSAWLDRRFAVLRHVYLLVVVMVGWVFFRVETLAHAGAVLAAMFGLQDGSQLVPLGELAVRADQLHFVALYTDTLFWLAAIAAVIGSTPWLPMARRWHERQQAAGRTTRFVALESAALLGLCLVFWRVAQELAANSYNPFIYFRF